MTEARASWAEACRAARLLAVDPSLGIVLRGPVGPARDHWIAGFRGDLPGDTPWRRLPAGTPLARLTGGLDLAATLATGRLVASAGLLADADGGMLVLATAERLDAEAAALLGRALDTGQTPDGDAPARFGLLALDDGREPEERTPDALADRLALRLDLSAFGPRDCGPIPPDARAIAAARRRLAHVSTGDDAVEALCEAALALGIAGMRAPLMAVKAARAAAALDDRCTVSLEDVALAARLVLGRVRRACRQRPPNPGRSPMRASRRRPTRKIRIRRAVARGASPRSRSRPLRLRSRLTCWPRWPPEASPRTAARAADATVLPLPPGGDAPYPRGAAARIATASSTSWRRCAPPRPGSARAAARRGRAC